MNPAERKQAILESAKRVFAAKGFHDAGVADVIADAGIARGTFYLYFKSKSEVFSALVENIIQTAIEKLVPMNLDEEDQVLENLQNNIDALKHYFADDPDTAKILMYETSALDPESSERLSDIFHRLVLWMTDLVEEAQKRGFLKQVNPGVVAHSFFGAIKQMMDSVFITGKLTVDPDRMFTDLLELYMFGLIRSDYKDSALVRLEEVKSSGQKNDHIN